jgi:hypothetical protein
MNTNFSKLDPSEVEKRLGKIIKKLKIENKISVDWIKEFTYNFDLPTNQISKKYFGKMMSLLPRNINENDMKEAMQAFNDAWNCFPQKIMNDKSPQDRFFDELGDLDDKNPEVLTEQDKMIKDHFEYAEKHLEEYLEWATKEIIPKYEYFLNKHKSSHIGNRMGVVNAFLELCGRYGFFEINNLHPMFISDFPDIFFKSFVGPKISKKNVFVYLNDFLNFIDLYYPRI